MSWLYTVLLIGACTLQLAAGNGMHTSGCRFEDLPCDRVVAFTTLSGTMSTELEEELP